MSLVSRCRRSDGLILCVSSGRVVPSGQTAHTQIQPACRREAEEARARAGPPAGIWWAADGWQWVRLQLGSEREGCVLVGALPAMQQEGEDRWPPICQERSRPRVEPLWTRERQARLLLPAGRAQGAEMGWWPCYTRTCSIPSIASTSLPPGQGASTRVNK